MHQCVIPERKFSEVAEKQKKHSWATPLYCKLNSDCSQNESDAFEEKEDQLQTEDFNHLNDSVLLL